MPSLRTRKKTQLFFSAAIRALQFQSLALQADYFKRGFNAQCPQNLLVLLPYHTLWVYRCKKMWNSQESYLIVSCYHYSMLIIYACVGDKVFISGQACVCVFRYVWQTATLVDFSSMYAGRF